MAKKEIKNEWFYKLVLALGFVFVGFLLGAVYVDRLDRAEGFNENYAVAAPPSVCEYSSPIESFKGDCSLAREIIELDRRKEEVVRKMDEVYDMKNKEFQRDCMNYMINELDNVISEMD